MWMFYFPYILSSHTKLFVLFRHLLDSSFLSRPLSSPNSASIPTTLILRFKITHSLSLVLSLPLFLSFTLSISFSLYFRFCFSWLQVRPQADLEVFFPSDLRDGLQGTYANKDVHGRTPSHTHSNTHTDTHRNAVPWPSPPPSMLLSHIFACLHLHIDLHNIVVLYWTEL